MGVHVETLRPGDGMDILGGGCTAIVGIFTTATLYRMCLLTGVCPILGRTFPARGALVTVHYVGKRLLWFWKSFIDILISNLSSLFIISTPTRYSDV